jgi:hypothetical protein
MNFPVLVDPLQLLRLLFCGFTDFMSDIWYMVMTEIKNQNHKQDSFVLKKSPGENHK